MHKLSEVRTISFPVFVKESGFLSIYEQANGLPFNIARVFVIKAEESADRGHHAHKECSQLMVVLSGLCTVKCDDGAEQKLIKLEKQNEGLLIPPTIWAEQHYEAGTILIVLTDRVYSESDYLRDYGDFLKFRGINQN